ncbi:HD domain-containing protein [Marmoricola sp. URHA0025 HA25]
MPEPSLNWPLPDRLDLEEGLIAAYSTGRGYHDLRHLTEVLIRLDELGQSDDVELVLAAWFHDAVYDGAPEAEERSARLAESELAGIGVAGIGVNGIGVDGIGVDGIGVDVAEVARLVRLTEHHDPEPGDHRGEALCDADLAILAAAPERYDEYAAGVRREYAAYSDADFRAGRLAVLQDLASREALFRTAYAREHWEPRARENLAREIGQLSDPASSAPGARP